MVIAGLTPREAVRAVEARLSAAGCPDADYDARELFRVAAGRDARLSDRVLTTEEAEKLEALCTRREQREPLQYLCGIWSFLDFDLAVGPGVLCPRADTEVVAEAAANTLTGIAAPRVLDLCAGTGCLGLGIKRFCPAAQVTCVEKSPEAFVYLEKNCCCALKGQGGQTEDLLEPTAFEQADAPAFDWGPALNFLTEHEIDSYPDLESRVAEITAASTEAAAALKAAERRLAEMAVLIKDVTTCKELHPLLQEYQRAADKKQFRRKHEGTLILYEAAAKALKEQGFQKLPDLYALKNEYKQLAEQKDQMQRQYNDAKRQMQEYGIIKQNVDGILRTAPGKEQMQER